MISHNESEGMESRNLFIALGQEFLHSEASIAAHVNGECVQRRAGVEVHSGSFNGSQRNLGEPCRSRKKLPTSRRGKAEVWRHGSRTGS